MWCNQHVTLHSNTYFKKPIHKRIVSTFMELHFFQTHSERFLTSMVPWLVSISKMVVSPFSSPPDVVGASPLSVWFRRTKVVTVKLVNGGVSTPGKVTFWKVYMGESAIDVMVIS